MRTKASSADAGQLWAGATQQSGCLTGFQEMTEGLLLLRSTIASITGDFGQACRMQNALRAGLGALPLSYATSSRFGGSWRHS